MEPTERANLLAARILEQVENLDQPTLASLLHEELQATAHEERRRCADEIARKSTYSARGGHFAEILRRSLPGS